MERPTPGSITRDGKSGYQLTAKCSDPKEQTHPCLKSHSSSSERCPSRLRSFQEPGQIVAARQPTVPLSGESVDASTFLPPSNEGGTSTVSGARPSFLDKLFRRKQVQLDRAGSPSSRDPSLSHTEVGHQEAARPSILGLLGNQVLPKERNITPKPSPSLSLTEKHCESPLALDAAIPDAPIPENDKDSTSQLFASGAVTAEYRGDPVPEAETVEDDEMPVESPSPSSDSSSQCSDGSQIQLPNPAASRSGASENSDCGPTLLYNWGSVVDKLLVGDAAPEICMSACLSKQQNLPEAGNMRISPPSLIDDQVFSMASGKPSTSCVISHEYTSTSSICFNSL